MTEPINEQEKENINNENSLDNVIYNHTTITTFNVIETIKGINKGNTVLNRKGLPNQQPFLLITKA
jgi:hypothetical protein